MPSENQHYPAEHPREILLRKPNGILIDVTTSVDRERAELRDAEYTAQRLRGALEAMVEAYVGDVPMLSQSHRANALAVRTLAELYPDEWHNRIPAKRRTAGEATP